MNRRIKQCFVTDRRRPPVSSQCRGNERLAEQKGPETEGGETAAGQALVLEKAGRKSKYLLTKPLLPLLRQNYIRFARSGINRQHLEKKVLSTREEKYKLARFRA